MLETAAAAEATLFLAGDEIAGLEAVDLTSPRSLLLVGSVSSFEAGPGARWLGVYVSSGDGDR